MQAYFSAVRPTAFLGDITTKNVLVHEGKLSGIVDVDEICYGDPLFVVGLTHMALLAMGADTDYTTGWRRCGQLQNSAGLFSFTLCCFVWIL